MAIGDVAWFRTGDPHGRRAINASNHNGDDYQIAGRSGVPGGYGR